MENIQNTRIRNKLKDITTDLTETEKLSLREFYE